MRNFRFAISCLAGAFVAVSGQSAPAGTDMSPSLPGMQPACHDVSGTPARYMSSDEYERQAPGAPAIAFASARYLEPSIPARPAIIFDAAFLNGLSDNERLFVSLHECHHLSSGDARETYRYLNGSAEKEPVKKTVEDEADCGAIRRMRDEFGASAADIAALEPLIRAVTGRKYKEDARIRLAASCYLN